MDELVIDDIEPWGDFTPIMIIDGKVHAFLYELPDWDDPYVKQQVQEHDREMAKLLEGSTLIFSSEGI